MSHQGDRDRSSSVVLGEECGWFEDGELQPGTLGRHSGMNRRKRRNDQRQRQQAVNKSEGRAQ